MKTKKITNGNYESTDGRFEFVRWNECPSTDAERRWTMHDRQDSDNDYCYTTKREAIEAAQKIVGDEAAPAASERGLQ